MPQLPTLWSLALLAALTACGSSDTVVAGPQTISASPHEVPFLGPVPVAGPRRRLCFDFDPPGESHNAPFLQAVLLAVDGRRDSVLDPSLDRRGEGRVCMIVPEPKGAEADRLRGTRYRGVELLSTGPEVRLHAIRWWSGR